MRCAIELDSIGDVQKFSQLAQGVDVDVRLIGKDENGNDWELSAKSTLCALLLGDHIRHKHAKNVDWNTIYCECEKDISFLIRDYVKQ